MNLTQHPASTEQVEAGVVEPESKDLVKRLLTFVDLPSAALLRERAEELATLSEGFEYALIGGAPFFMAPLQSALGASGTGALYAFSRRESVEKTLPNGEVVKSSVFRHIGFVPACQ